MRRPSEPCVSFVLATRNRRAVLLHTLARVYRCGLGEGTFEVIVVDNASSDETCSAVRACHPNVTLVRLSRNLGSCAKALAVDRARGPYVVFLDDDSYPQPGTVDRMVRHFESDARLGAAGCIVHLPDARTECSAFPNVFIGCGVGLRAAALRAVGGLDPDLFMQAEEYDLSFRLINAGWHVETFDDLHVDHLKTARARITARTTYYDTRNNLLLVERYLAPPYRGVYRRDWTQRYRWLAATNRHMRSFARALASGTVRGRLDRHRYTDRRLTPGAFETLFRIDYVATRMAALRHNGVRRLVLADLGKNVYAFYRGALQAGISILAIADDRFAASGRHYRGVPILPAEGIAALDPDAVVVSNTSPVHASTTRARLADSIAPPVHAWFGGFPDDPASDFVPSRCSADRTSVSRCSAEQVAGPRADT